MGDDPPTPPDLPGPPPRRQAGLYLLVGVVVAGLLAVVLFVGVGTGRRPQPPSVPEQVTAADLQPGINGPTSLLLTLTVLPRGQHKRAPQFRLTDQHGRPVSMRAFRGKVVVLSANDDRCQDLCTLLANDIVTANRDLGPAAKHVVWLSVNANPFYPKVSDVRSWTDRHGLAGSSNWHFGTAAPPALRRVWKDYGIAVEADARTRSVDHSTELFFVDPSGRERAVAEFGSASADTSLFAHGVAQMADDLLPASERTHVAGPETPAPTAGSATIDARAPAFDLPSLTPGHRRLASRSLRGHYAVLDFWSTTCTLCRVELPRIEAAYRYAEPKVRFVGIDVSDQAGPARRLAARAHVTYPLVSDRAGTAAGAERITGLPYTVILDPRGRIVIRHPGVITTEQLKYLLQGLVPSLPAG